MRLIGRYSYQYVRFGEQAYDFPADAERYLAHMASRDGDFDSPEDLPSKPGFTVSASASSSAPPRSTTTSTSRASASPC